MLASLTRPGRGGGFSKRCSPPCYFWSGMEDGRYPERTPAAEPPLAVGGIQPAQHHPASARGGTVHHRYQFSDGSPPRRRELLALLGTDAAEEVLDPGLDVVTRRLSRGGQLSAQCSQAIGRWYTRIG